MDGNMIKDKNVDFINIQDDIYKFIRQTQVRMSKNGFSDPVESYAIFFVILWHEAEAFIKFIERNRDKDLTEVREHLRGKIEEVMDGKGPESIRFN
jgi:hypothetical protein